MILMHFLLESLLLHADGSISDEMLQHKMTGYIYDFDKPEELTKTILYSVKHVEETIKMKSACIARAKDYSEEYVMKYIAKQMGIER